LIDRSILRFLFAPEFGQGFSLNIDGMNSGACVLTYNWGNSFKQFMKPGSQVAEPNKFKVAPTPGSKQVLDRSTMQLVDCTPDLCPHGTNYSDIGLINQAPYLAFGGWACAVNNYTDPGRKPEAAKLCAFASSKQVSTENIIPSSTGNGTSNGQDPYRMSHLNNTRYELQGYEVTATNEYLKAIKSGLDHPNAVIDIRFPTASDINALLDRDFHDHLNATLHGEIDASDLPSRRAQLAASLTNKWERIIQKYDALPTTKVHVLEIEQKLRGVYSPPINYNQINSMRIYGYIGIAVIWAIALVSIVWTLWYKKMKVVRASQPFFLVMICFGAVVFGSVIVPFSIDDGIASVEVCSQACMSIPWLVFLGWSILFSALFAKIWRVNLVYKNSMKFRRLTVSETDVLRPFAFLFLTNVTLLTVWTVLDPLTWTRVKTSPLDSYGACAAGDSNVWIVCISFLSVLNGAALFLANFQAYRARNLSTEYGESKYIGMAMACILQVTIVGVPLLFLVNTNPPADYFVRCTIVLVICLSILLLIFVPKMWHLYRNRTLTPLHRSTTNVSGLTFLVLDKNAMLEQEARIRGFKHKLKVLKEMLQAEGLDAEAMMQRAGLTAADLKISTVLADSKLESYPGSARQGTGGITASSGAESLVSIQRSSGVETSDDDGDNGNSYATTGGKRVSFVNNSRNVSIEEGDDENSSGSEAPEGRGGDEQDEGDENPRPSFSAEADPQDLAYSRLEI
jgi:7 transmembrane sweet-taste receptor of 3 GCPR